MGILVPGFFGLSIFIAGLVIFYMFRKQYTEQVISSNLLWEQVMNEWQATKWWRKLQRQLLLLLQILILLFLMLALVRPFFHTEGMEGDHVILLLDSSASMATVVDEEGTTRFEQAKKEMLALLDKRSREQAVSIIAVGATPTLVVNRELDQRTMEVAVEELELTYEHREFQRALSLAKALSEQQSSSVYVFSDQLTEADWEESQITSYFRAVNVDSETTEPLVSLSLTTFGVNTTGESASAVATLRNESSEEQAFTLQFSADGEAIHQESATIEGDGQVFINVEGLPPATFYEARILEEDSYALDNVAYSFSSSEAKPVLYLIGEINPFLHKVFVHLGHDIVQAEKLDDIHEFTRNSIVVTAGEATELESIEALVDVGRPLLLLASPEEEVVPFENPLEAKLDNELFAYADVDELYISQGRAPILESSRLVETILSSGDVPLIQKGTEGGLAVVQLLFDIQDSDWPLHPSFPIFIYNTLEFLTGESGHLGYFAPNEQRVLQLETPGTYQVMDGADNVIASFDRDSESFQAPRKPGLYYLLDSEEQRTYFAVTLDEREKVTTAQASFSKNGSEAEDTAGSAVWEWWPWLLLVAFILVLVEWEVYRRGIRT